MPAAASLRLFFASLFLASLATCGRTAIEEKSLAQPVAVILPGSSNTLTGRAVTISGATSYDPEDETIAYSWRIIAAPKTSAVVLAQDTLPSVTITPDRSGTYVVELVVTAGLRSNSAVALITAVDAWTAPIANAGSDVFATTRDPINFDGSKSFDPGGGELTFSWAVLNAPASSRPSLINPTTPTPTFRPDLFGEYDVELAVSARGFTATDVVHVTVTRENGAPFAIAGGNKNVTVGNTVQLDGSMSSDPEGGLLTYAWRVVSAPLNGQAVLSSNDSAVTTFVPRAAGSYVIELKVSDPEGLSDTDQAVVVASAGADAGSTMLDPAEIYLGGTLSEGACYRDALAKVSTPNVASTGFDCYFNERTAMIRPTDGRLLYSNTFEDKVRVYQCDECSYSGTYPTAPLANDTVIPPPCPAGELMSQFRVSPSGLLLQTCSGSNTQWRNAAGTVIYDGSSDTLVALGDNGWILTKSRVVNPSLGQSATIVGLPASSWITTRWSGPSAFNVVVSSGSASSAPELWKVFTNGATQRIGAYPAMPGGTSVGQQGRIDAQGNLFELSRDTTQSFIDIIVKRVPNGTATIVYTESSNPLVKVHISGLITGP